MSGKKNPIFTTGNVGSPSVPYIPTQPMTYVNAWNGQILDGLPTYGTPTGLPKGHKNEYFHGGIKLNGENVISCHNPSIYKFK